MLSLQMLSLKNLYRNQLHWQFKFKPKDKKLKQNMWLKNLTKILREKFRNFKLKIKVEKSKPKKN